MPLLPSIPLATAAALFASMLGIAPAHGAETLRQAVSAAIVRFPEIHAAQYRRDALRAQIGQARAELLPSLDSALGIGRERSRNLTSVRAPTGDDISLTRQEATLSASQLVYDGGAAGSQVRRAAARADGAELNVIGTIEDVAFRTGQVFIDVRRLREQVAIARQNIGVHEKTLSDVAALADAGRGRRADVTQAEARRLLAASAAEQLAGQLAQAVDAFRHLTGRPPGELAEPPALAPELPAQAEQAVNQALALHPAVRAAEKEVEAAQHDRDSARARMVVPRVTIEGGASRNRDVDGISGPNNDLFAMLRLRYNLFRGGGDTARVVEAEARIDETISSVARVRVDVERDVRQAWDALVSDRLRVPQLEQYARASADVAEAYRLQFQLGQRSLLDVLNAENERYNAFSSLIAGRATLAANELRVLASQGRLVDALGLGAQVPPLERPSRPPEGWAGAPRPTCYGVPTREGRCVGLRLESGLRSEGASAPAERGP